MCSQGITGQGSGNNVTVLGKEVPCLVDSGCEVKLALKSLIDRFSSIEIRPTTSKVRAANNNPI